MWNRNHAVSLLAGALLLGAGAALAANEPVYGSQLMTRAERIEHRNKMRSLKTPEEREQYRAEHHARMQERAREKGVTLPDSPPPGGMGKGMGQGPEMGMGRGGAMGPRDGMGPGTNR